MGKSNLFRLAALILAMTCFSNLCIADVIHKKDTVTGIVIDKKKQPLPGAKVEIVGQPFSAFTDIDGRFDIKCDPGAKKVRVTYPKLKPKEQKITPDMTVKVGRKWRGKWYPAPENYQWFVGADLGFGLTYVNMDSPEISSYEGYTDLFVYPSLSVMAGRCKSIGWYTKAFINPALGGVSKDEDNPYPDSRCFNTGLILGGMVKIKGRPAYFYLGGGFGYTNMTKIPTNSYKHYSWQFNIGYLFRIQDKYGVNCDYTLGHNKDIVFTAPLLNIGFCYFFNK